MQRQEELQSIAPDLADVQFDMKCQLRLNHAFQRELCAEVSRFCLIKHAIEDRNVHLKRRYHAIERALAPITIIRPSAPPRTSPKKPGLTQAQTIKALADLCSPEVADLVKDLMTSPRRAGS